MWILRVYNQHDDELVAEHDLGVDDAELQRILGSKPTRLGSNPLDHDALRKLDQSIESLRRPGRESWHGAECFLDFDAEPGELDAAGPTGRSAARLSRN